MAKMRGVKPEFWTDEKVVEVSFAARLLFIGMWNHACDNGHIEDKPRQIKMRVFPADNVDIDALIRELVDVGLVHRGDGYLTVPKLGVHQRLDMRWFLTCDAPHCEKHLSKEGLPAVATTGPRSGHAVDSTGPRDEMKGDEMKVRGTDGEMKGNDAPRATFAEFWNMFPKRQGDSEFTAAQAWTEATKHATPRIILDGAKRYATDPNLPDPQFLPAAKRWLNERRWANGPLPPRYDRAPQMDRATQTYLADAARYATQENSEGVTQLAIGQ